MTPGDKRNVAFGHDWPIKLPGPASMDLDGDFTGSKGLGHKEAHQAWCEASFLSAKLGQSL